MGALKFAIDGIKTAVLNQKNIKIQIAIAVIVTVAGLLVNLSFFEWIAVVFCIGLVIVSELFNTAIELFVDFVQPEHHITAGKIKDVSAGAVLVAVCTAVISGLIIFVPKITGMWQ